MKEGGNKTGSFDEEQKFELSFYSQGLSHMTISIYPAVLFRLVSVLPLS